jgi:hypothetical protein
MAQQTAITLTDGASTPVARVFKPARRIGETVLEYQNRAGGIAAGNDKLYIEYRAPSRQLKSTKVSFKLVIPTLEQTSASTSTGIQPAPQKAYEHLVKLEFTCPERGTTQERKNALYMARDLIDEALAADAVIDLDPVLF